MFYRACRCGLARRGPRDRRRGLQAACQQPRGGRRRQAAEADYENRPRRVVPEAEPMLKILFLCTGNSCRSQMAEGWARHLKGDQIEPYSAGIEAHGLNPDAVRVMAEAGVDISGQRSKLVSELSGVDFDYVVTVCDNAHESCPLFPGKAKVVHVGLTIRRGWRPTPRRKTSGWPRTAGCGTKSAHLWRRCPIPLRIPSGVEQGHGHSLDIRETDHARKTRDPDQHLLASRWRNWWPSERPSGLIANRASSTTTAKHGNWACPKKTWPKRWHWRTK